MHCRGLPQSLVLAAVFLVSASVFVAGGTAFLVNDTGYTARSLTLEFTEPVQIEGFGELFSHSHPSEASVEITLTDGRVSPLYSIWVRWSPETAELVGAEWLAHGGGVQLDAAIPSDPPFIDPSLLEYSDHAGWQIVQLLFTGLFGVHGETGELYPELVRSWEVSSDGLEWTFSLREDALWSDGQPVTAEDARFALLRAFDPSSGYPGGLLYVVENSQAYSEGEVDDPREVGIEAIGSHVLRMKLTEPMAHLPWVLTLPGYFPLPQHAVERHSDQWTSPENIVTCGPYHLLGQEPGEWFLLERAPEFFDGKSGLIPRVKLWIADEKAAWSMYSDDLLDTAAVPHWALADVPEGDTVDLVPGRSALQTQGTFFCYFNTTTPPFDDVLVRKALSAAVDRERLVERLALDGDTTALPAWTLAPIPQLGLAPSEEKSLGIPFDPVQAQAWLAEAGHPLGDELAVIHLYYHELDLLRRTVVWPFLKEQWERHLGCRVDIHEISLDEFRSMFWDQQPPLAFYGFKWDFDYLEASNTLDWAFNRFMIVRVGPFRQHELDSLLLQAARIDGLEERQELYRAAEKLLLEEEAVTFPLFRFAVNVASKPHLERSCNDWMALDISTWRFILEEL